MLAIDGSQGEGGGQVLRTSLALSLVTGRPFRIEKIRAGRPKPGLARQHLAAVEGAQRVGAAEVEGAALGSQALTFRPGALQTGRHELRVGSAGSATLVLQTVLPALLRAGAPTELVIEGGTHNPLAPPFDFLARAYLPLVERTGPRIEAALDRPGFAPRGGGRLRARVSPVSHLTPFELLERGELRARRIVARTADLPREIAEREAATLARLLAWRRHEERIEELPGFGPGNVLLAELEHEHVTEVFTAFGEKGVRAEEVARRLSREVKAYEEAPVPVGEHLADQLLLILALAGGGAFATTEPSGHTTTQVSIIKLFLEVSILIEQVAGGRWVVRVSR